MTSSSRSSRPRAIILGASSGIGRALAHELAARGYQLGLAARRGELLETLRVELGDAGTVTRSFDMTALPDARMELQALIEELGGLDLAVISSGTGHLNPELRWELEGG